MVINGGWVKAAGFTVELVDLLVLHREFSFKKPRFCLKKYYFNCPILLKHRHRYEKCRATTAVSTST